MNLVEGDLMFLDYGEVPKTIHTRLIGAHLTGETYIIITPDSDVYEEELHLRNTDLVDVIPGLGGLGSPLPPTLNPAEVYSFRPMSAQQYQAVMAQARTYAAQLRIQMGLPPPGLAAAAGGAVAGQQQQQVEPRVWVSLENEFGKVVGEVVIDEGGALPVGHVALGGSKALIPMGQGALAIKQVPKKDVDSMGVRDLRVLPLVFDQQGNRRQDFSAVVARMTHVDMPGGGLQLDGPASTLGVLKSMVARGLTPVTDHEHWVRTHDLPRGDRSVYEMEVITRALEAFAMSDQLNLPCSKGIELLLRRWQLIREAHRISPGAPDYSSSDVFMGWEYRRGEGVHPDLAKFVASELKDQASIAKEARKAREEMANRKKGGGKKDAAADGK